jgi:hypothetical protein
MMCWLPLPTATFDRLTSIVPQRGRAYRWALWQSGHLNSPELPVPRSGAPGPGSKKTAQSFLAKSALIMWQSSDFCTGKKVVAVPQAVPQGTVPEEGGAHRT